ncbi:peroxisome biogenesis protein 22 isoform X1 [Dendrobium catenatum]|uniref:Peroxisome biogenesis protein 22 n=1 Tax=Dendrobium catenatum TaxID=906689 RepID=A0A2I0XCX8_9ASPA|nr:peroxisome biogenesis protein 22 isoform X1 [Dendrobium catenatum]XP_020702873.1 peroxisome biogenesis protein 22 isoform X1 [Dendrobium catenatum]PKU85772.1 Peroxisome biogenesis protein 22 [Dendrobium catenatum]
MSDRVADDAISLVRRLTRNLNRKVSDIVLLLLNHKSAGSFGAVAGLAIAVVFTWKFLRSPPDRGRRRTPKRNVLPSANGGPSSGVAAEDPPTVPNLRDSDGVQENGSPYELSLGQIVRKRLGGCRKVTCQLLGVILEEKNPEELQKHATVRPSVVEVLQEITKCCDFYLMERVLDDESEERVLSAMENAGLFGSGGLNRDKVLFCGTENGRISFVRQIESDWHIDSNLDIISQLTRFIRCQLYIYSDDLGQIAPNVITSTSLEQYLSQIS